MWEGAQANLLSSESTDIFNEDNTRFSIAQMMKSRRMLSEELG